MPHVPKLIFFFVESPEATALQRCEQSPRRRACAHPRCEPCPRGRAAPQIHMLVGPRSSRSRRKGPQGATPRTRPPAPPPLGRRPQAAWAVHCTTRRPRTLVPAPSIKRISLSNPEGPRRDGCRRPAPPSTLGLFYPDARLSRPPTASRNPVSARPAQSAARLATRSRPGLVLQAPRRSAMPGGTITC